MSEPVAKRPSLTPRRVTIAALLSAGVAIAITVWVSNAGLLQASQCAPQSVAAQKIDAVAVGQVSGAAIATLEGLLEMLLQTGRARWRHGPESERDLLRLFHRTPGGSTARRTTEAVNQALRELKGQVLQNLLFTPHGPGVFKLGLQTDQCKLALVIDSHGVSVESLEV